MTQMTRMTAKLSTSVICSYVRLAIFSIISVTHPFKKITNTITRIKAHAFLGQDLT